MSIIGSLLYKLYYKPKGKKDIVSKFGGKDNYKLMLKGEDEMRKYTFTNLKIDYEHNSNCRYKINFLTGEKYIHQSLFCIHSFISFLSDDEKLDFSISFYDDGSLTTSTLDFLKTNHPAIKVIPAKETLVQINKVLPAKNYPFIHKKIKDYPFIKKLLYPHINNSGINCLFDSDMLFVKRPSFLLDWLKANGENKAKALGMLDVKRFYGYNDSEIRTIWPKNISNNINSGMYAIHTENVNFDLMEDLIQKFETSYGPNYYLEQMITAILLENSGDLDIVPQPDYIVLPAKAQILERQGTLHHYVDTSKEWYFKEAWKAAI